MYQLYLQSEERKDIEEAEAKKKENLIMGAGIAKDAAVMTSREWNQRTKEMVATEVDVPVLDQEEFIIDPSDPTKTMKNPNFGKQQINKVTGDPLVKKQAIYEMDPEYVEKNVLSRWMTPSGGRVRKTAQAMQWDKDIESFSPYADDVPNVPQDYVDIYNQGGLEGSETLLFGDDSAVKNMNPFKKGFERQADFEAGRQSIANRKALEATTVNIDGEDIALGPENVQATTTGPKGAYDVNYRVAPRNPNPITPGIEPGELDALSEFDDLGPDIVDEGFPTFGQWESPPPMPSTSTAPPAGSSNMQPPVQVTPQSSGSTSMLPSDYSDIGMDLAGDVEDLDEFYQLYGATDDAAQVSQLATNLDTVEQVGTQVLSEAGEEVATDIAEEAAGTSSKLGTVTGALGTAWGAYNLTQNWDDMSTVDRALGTTSTALGAAALIPSPLSPFLGIASMGVGLLDAFWD